MKQWCEDFPGGPVVKNVLVNAGYTGSILGWETKIPHAEQGGKKKKKVSPGIQGFPQSVQSLSHVQLFATPCTAAHKASLSLPVSWSLLKLMSVESVMPSKHLSSVDPFFSCLQAFPASGSFPRSQFLH